MVKSSTTITSYIFVAVLFCIGILFLAIMKHHLPSGFFSIDRLSVILLMFVFPLWLLTKFKTVVVDDRGIEVRYRFVFRRSFHTYSDIDHYQIFNGISRGGRYQAMKIFLRDGKKIIVNSNLNTRFTEVDLFLQQKITRIQL